MVVRGPALASSGRAVYGFQESSQAPLRLDFGAGGDEAMLVEFVSAIRDGRRPQPDGEAGLRSLRVAARAYESYASMMPA
jgi:1,5-anhydro-D-fructose reductase (1,5-anhydro-D-mannitol-forming)